MGLIERFKQSGSKFSGLIFEILQELRFTITSNPEIDSQGGSAIWNFMTGAVDSLRFRDAVKNQTGINIDSQNDIIEIPSPYKLKARKVQADYLSPIGEFGLGAGWADEGFINDLAVLLFDSSATEKSTYLFYAVDLMLLDLTNPVLDFTVYSTTAAGAAEQVVFDLTCKYIALGESPSKAADETLNQTYVMTDIVANNRQNNMTFTLDRNLISSSDVLFFTLTRDGGNVNDTYGSDIGIGQCGLIYDKNIN